jgi:hypothetical protein
VSVHYTAIPEFDASRVDEAKERAVGLLQARAEHDATD